MKYFKRIYDEFKQIIKNKNIINVCTVDQCHE